MKGKLRTLESDLKWAVEHLGTIAVIGMKDKTAANQPAYQIPKMLMDRGYDVVPINPKLSSVEGCPVYKNYSCLPEGAHTVNIFRRSEFVEDHVDEMLLSSQEKWPRLVWMQTGIINEAAAQKLLNAGIDVVMDQCLGVYVSRYGLKS